MKSIKFRDYLVKLVLSGEKDSTWRIFDDKNLTVGDVVDLINWNTGLAFGKAKLLDIKEKKVKDLGEEDFDGHEKYENEEAMYKELKKFYGEAVTGDTIVKIIKFKVVENENN